ncbi:MAG: excinuclease ABC subunit UvrC [Bacteroidales bacterium]|nr:excinuclease ABC subunit UvrC [Bacteroidales bacterium]MCB8999801.1 excinuclease ABC subunit UvrC [Bacteroidales bacterium]
MTAEKNGLKDLILNLPGKPGVYQFYDASGSLLYIGKAKNLKKRVSSYFSQKHYENNKLKVLVKKIAGIKHIVVDTESDALLLENNLIKKYQPKYNVNLKDDKTFPWICIKNEAFPRVFSTRNIIQDGSKYYGPYTSAFTVKTLLSLIRQLYKLRTCPHNLSADNLAKKKIKRCLEYHIGNCLAPCEGLQNEEDYNKSIEQIHLILKGNLKDLLAHMAGIMKNYASEYKFEEAELIRQKMELLEKFQTKSTIVNPSIHNVDVFSIVQDKDTAWVNFMKVVNGAIIQAHTVELNRKLDETTEELLEFAVTEIRTRLYSDAREIILPFEIEGLPKGCSQTIPKIGDKHKLLELSERNAKYFMMERKRQKASISPEKSYMRILTTLKADLRLSSLPVHIECFDNSNIQGSDPVAACVVFKNARPAKKEYRHFNVKTVEGPDDFASMREIVFRRYSRLLDEHLDLPQLIIIDGGKGQLSAAVESLEKLELRGKVAIIGIAKKLEEIYFPGDPVPLYIDKNSESLKLIQQLRNEAHRFGITFHRLKRSNSMTNTGLIEIPGFGESTIKKLWSNFDSIDEMKKASFEKLSELLGEKKAKSLKSYLDGLK